MGFITDQQTFTDLQLFARRGSDSIYGIFNRTVTRQGAGLLEEMFQYPLSDADAINERSQLFALFAGMKGGFPFQADLFDVAEQYLSVTDERTRLSAAPSGMGSGTGPGSGFGRGAGPGAGAGFGLGRLAGLLADDNAYKTLYKGMTALIRILQDLHRFLSAMEPPAVYQRQRMTALTIFAAEEMRGLLTEGARIPYERVVIYDSYLRFRRRDIVRKLLQYVYELDVYFSVGATAVQTGFAFPRALSASEEMTIRLEGIYHPLVKGAVSNTMRIGAGNHILFLTGANMAGKSTFMKTMGVVLYLAHMGFPVPAASLSFTVLDGIFTTINLPDDLGSGVSHFYAEVQRIKAIARQLHQGKRLFVIFDEIFRGTNVKDAYEATVALTRAFAVRKDSVLLLSTHIIEAGEVLAGRDSGIEFIYLPTRMEGPRPVYTYRLEQGITPDRHGMVIIENEGIFEILARGLQAGDGAAAGSGVAAAGVAGNGEAFLADAQTLDDLNLTGKYKPGSIFSLFNKVETEGAERLLEEMFRQPLTDPRAINARSQRFLYLQGRTLVFPLRRAALRMVEDYLRSAGGGSRAGAYTEVLRLRAAGSLLRDERYDQLLTAVQAVIDVIRIARIWFGELQSAAHEPIRAWTDTAMILLDDPRLGTLSFSGSWRELAGYHYLLGSVLAEPLRAFCGVLYELDLGITVGRIASERDLGYAIALPRQEQLMEIRELRHPGVNGAVGNTVSLRRDSHMIFLTGANMAGKSTLMKSFGIAVYLAHMGFPVAAAEMAFSVRDGLYTSINVPDDLQKGHSHFYAETLRVKEAAIAISGGRQLVVIFDELFKGTNVKDAYDATLAVSSAFAGYRHCLFMISTHIIEVGEALQRRSGLQFLFMPTVMDGPVPRYTYRLSPGITSDRHGMRIIENEGIFELFLNHSSI